MQTTPSTNFVRCLFAIFVTAQVEDDFSRNFAHDFMPVGMHPYPGHSTVDPQMICRSTGDAIKLRAHF